MLRELKTFLAVARHGTFAAAGLQSAWRNQLSARRSAIWSRPWACVCSIAPGGMRLIIQRYSCRNLPLRIMFSKCLQIESEKPF
jgi:hypothetical protein